MRKMKTCQKVIPAHCCHPTFTVDRNFPAPGIDTA